MYSSVKENKVALFQVELKAHIVSQHDYIEIWKASSKRSEMVNVLMDEAYWKV